MIAPIGAYREENSQVARDEPDGPVQVADAKVMFQKRVDEGMVPYRVIREEKGERQATVAIMNKFEETANEVVFHMRKAIVGG